MGFGAHSPGCKDLDQGFQLKKNRRVQNVYWNPVCLSFGHGLELIFPIHSGMRRRQEELAARSLVKMGGQYVSSTVVAQARKLARLSRDRLSDLVCDLLVQEERDDTQVSATLEAHATRATRAASDEGARAEQVRRRVPSARFDLWRDVEPEQCLALVFFEPSAALRKNHEDGVCLVRCSKTVERDRNSRGKLVRAIDYYAASLDANILCGAPPPSRPLVSVEIRGPREADLEIPRVHLTPPRHATEILCSAYASPLYVRNLTANALGASWPPDASRLVLDYAWYPSAGGFVSRRDLMRDMSDCLALDREASSWDNLEVACAEHRVRAELSLQERERHCRSTLVL